MRVDWCVCVVVVSYQEYSLTHLQWVAGIKKTAFGGTPPFLSLSTALIHPTPWFLSSGRGTQARAPARRILGKR